MTGLQEVLAWYQRIAIVGGCDTGKSTLGRSITDRKVFEAELFESIPHEDIPHAMLAATNGCPRFAIESVMTARMLRKAARLGLPCPVDAVVYLHKPHRKRSARQIGQAKGIHKVLTDWRALDRVTPVYVFE